MSGEATLEFVQPGYGASSPEPWWLKAGPRRWLLILLALVPLLTPVLSPKDDGPFIYPYCTAMQLMAAWFCWHASHRYPMEKLRWRIVSLAQCLHAVAYAAATLEYQNWATYNQKSWLANACGAACWVLFLPALMGSRSLRGKWVRGLDRLLTVTTCLLLMQAMGSGPRLGEGKSRVMVSMLAMVFVTLAALVARVASARAGIRLFSSVMLLYLSVALLVCFLLNVVNVYWMRQPNILGSDMLIALPSLLLCEWTVSWKRPDVMKLNQLDPALVDSLQPSMMALGGVLLALYGFRADAMTAGAAVVAIVFLYALRTQLFYQQLFVQQKQLRSQASQMEELATRDALTGVANRRWFDAEAGKLLDAGRSYPCSLVLVDTDKFKEINDSFGHPVGDEVLRAVAGVLSEVTAQVKRGCCARIGGDEFGALWPGVAADEAKALAETVRLRVEALEHSAPVAATVSVGLATAQETLSLGKLMRWADAALYRSKTAGRNAVRAMDLGELKAGLEE